MFHFISFKQENINLLNRKKCSSRFDEWNKKSLEIDQEAGLRKPIQFASLRDKKEINHVACESARARILPRQTASNILTLCEMFPLFTGL